MPEIYLLADYSRFFLAQTDWVEVWGKDKAEQFFIAYLTGHLLDLAEKFKKTKTLNIDLPEPLSKEDKKEKKKLDKLIHKTGRNIEMKTRLMLNKQQVIAGRVASLVKQTRRPDSEQQRIIIDFACDHSDIPVNMQQKKNTVIFLYRAISMNRYTDHEIVQLNPSPVFKSRFLISATTGTSSLAHELQNVLMSFN